MCVIAVANKRPLTHTLMVDAHFANDDGIGAAWIDNGKVHWVKGISTAEEAFEFVQELPLPYVVHFRMCSSGPNTPEMTHPFPFGGSLKLSGSTDRGVLFHNGHWNDWAETMLRLLPPDPKAVPKGPWNDTRAMAWIIGRWGTRAVNFISQSQKLALVTPQGITLHGGGWVRREGYTLSNDYFEYSYRQAAVAHSAMTGTPVTTQASLPSALPARRFYDLTDREWYDMNRS